MQDNDIQALQEELSASHSEAIDYFDAHITAITKEIEAITETGDFLRYQEISRLERATQSTITEEDRQRVSEIIARLIRVMSKILLAIKVSPVTEEADYHEFVLSMKQMRAALQFRIYRAWNSDAIHDEGTILGIVPAGQREDDADSIRQAKKAFQDAYANAQYIIALITPGYIATAQSSANLSTQPATKYVPNTAFIMMWMNKDHPELDDVRDTIIDVFQSFGIRAVRADDIEHEDVITNRILEAISTSEFLIADLTGERPSVYYEVGYAHALRKRVILYRRQSTSLHFDLAGYNCPEYENLRDLREQLTRRLQIATNRNPNS